MHHVGGLNEFVEIFQHFRTFITPTKVGVQKRHCNSKPYWIPSFDGMMNILVICEYFNELLIAVCTT